MGSITSLVQYGTSERSKEEPVGVPVLRIPNLQADGWDLSDLKYMEATDEELAAYRLSKGDILFNRTNGSKDLVGKCDVFEFDGDWVFASYLIRLRIDPLRAMPRFVTYFLNTGSGRKQVEHSARQMLQSNINTEEIRALLIPLPDVVKQRELVAAMDAKRDARQRGYDEADATLTGIDAFVLQSLRLGMGDDAGKTRFAVRRREILGRIDPDYYSPRFRSIREAIEHGHFGSEAVGEFCTSIRVGFAAGKQDQVFDYDEGVPHLRPLNLNILGEISLSNTKFVPKKYLIESDYCINDEVLFNNTNSEELIGKSAVFEMEQACACSNHMTRLGLRHGLDPHYLASVLNALRSTGYLGLLSTKFNNQAGINLDTLRATVVPICDPKTQAVIATEVRRRRDEARRLRSEAESNWDAAKQWFEDQLLGPTPP